jgi:hypothetical protein
VTGKRIVADYRRPPGNSTCIFARKNPKDRIEKRPSILTCVLFCITLSPFILPEGGSITLRYGRIWPL